LRVVETALDSITLAWTAPAVQGDGLFYDARYLAASEMGTETQITEALWAVADTVAGEPPVSPAGTDESLVIGGLPMDVEHFVAIRTVRGADGVTSGISNTVSATTDAFIWECSQPFLQIPDAPAPGVADVMTFPDQLEIGGVQVYVNITHTYIGDLIVEVTSPGGTTVRLHDMSGGSADNIIGTYGLDLSVDGPGSLNDFIDELSQGDWTLWVSDNWGLDVGTLNEWCVGVWGSVP
jgi:subtilisin-like proprotein convertase family protein